MKTERFLAELEVILEHLGYRIRKEAGNFKGDLCVLEGEKIVMINKKFPPEYHLGQIIRFLKRQDMNDIFIKPAVRKELSRWFEKINKEQQSTL